MHRITIPTTAIQADRITVRDPKRLHHLLRVLRVKAGDRLQCVDGRGGIYAGPIIQCARSAVSVAIEVRNREAPVRAAVTLAQAIIRPERFEWMIQKATELGVTSIIPTITSRTRIQSAGSLGGARLARWQRIAEEASAQCGRATIPTIEPPQPFDQVLERLGVHYGLMLTLASDAVPLEHHLGKLEDLQHVLLLIGPEGDFSLDEVQIAKQRGMHIVRLGRMILRAETAAIAVLAIVQQALGEL